MSLVLDSQQDVGGASLAEQLLFILEALDDKFEAGVIEKVDPTLTDEEAAAVASTPLPSMLITGNCLQSIDN